MTFPRRFVLIVCVCLIGWQSSASAQGAPTPPAAALSQAPPANANRLIEAERFERSGRRRANLGVAMVFAGIGAAVAGGVLLARAEEPNGDDLGFSGAYGFLLLFGGGTLAVSGIPITASGKIRLEKAKRLRASVSVAPARKRGALVVVRGRF